MSRLTKILSLWALLLCLWMPGAWAADYYWVGGSGNLNTAETGHISTSSGGSGGSGPVTSADNLTFDTNSNIAGSGASYTVTATTTAPTVANITFGHPSAGTLTVAGSSSFNIYGSLSVASGVVWTNSNTVAFKGTTAGHTITTNGVVFPNNFTFNGAGGGWTLVDSLTLNSNLIYSNGNFSDGGQSISMGKFDGSASNARTLTKSGNWTITGSGTGAGDFSSSTITLSDTAGWIKFTDASTTAKTLDGGSGKTFNQVWFTGAGTGDFRILGSNTIGTLTVDTPPQEILFQPSQTQTIGTFNVSGTSGNLMTLDTTTGLGTFTLAKSGGGTVSSDYLSVTRSTATPGSTWYAGANSTNGGTNSGWTFTAPPAPSNTSNGFFMF
jgi:hypothetical protein